MNLKKVGAASVAAIMCMSAAQLLLGSSGAGAASMGDREALSEAKLYLSTEPFSLQGLIAQLKYGGYTTAQAIYGANHAGANWYKESLLYAKEYLSTEAFSKSGLLTQLEYSKFTASQAAYGVAHCGANWNTEAYKSAKEYLATQSFSKSALIGQLEFSGFTAAQATYGADKAY
jgi:hypothetical protein